MKGKRVMMVVTLAVLLTGLLAGGVAGQTGTSAPLVLLGTGFTYQGKLADGGGTPISGDCDFQFGLWDAASGGAQIGSTCTAPAVEVVEGVFTTLVNAAAEFGSSAFVGQARWLEVAVRCPAGGGSYTTLSPRQPLTAAPAALSLALPYQAEANIGGPLISFWNSGDGEAAVFGSQAGYALWVESAGLDGLHVASAGQDGVHVIDAGGSGLVVDTADGEGVYVGSVDGMGVRVGATGHEGVYVGAAGWDGVYVESAGIPTTVAASPTFNGFEVAGAEGCGLAVGWADMDGAYVSSAGYRGFAVGAAGTDGVSVYRAGNPSASTPSNLANGIEVAGAGGDGLYVGRAENHGVEVVSVGGYGLYVESAGSNGVQVGWAGDDGMWVGTTIDNGVWVSHAGTDGVHINRAGNPSVSPPSSSNNGFEVAGAEGYGLYVGRAELDGVYVKAAAWHGMNVDSALVDGLYVNWAGDDGVDVAGNDYAGNFRGYINVTGSCTGCTIAAFGLNVGDGTLEPGQIVTIQGIQASTLDNAEALWRVIPAGEGVAAIGVVGARAELDAVLGDAQSAQEEIGQRLVPREGAAKPGEYVTIIIYGPVQVKANALDGSIQPGIRLAVDGKGEARALKTVAVEGVTVAESAPTVGIALGAQDEDGLVWVLVNPQ